MTELVLSVCLAASGQPRGPVSPPPLPPPPRNLPGPPPPPARENARGDRIELCKHDGSDEELRELVKKSPKAKRMRIGWPGLTDSALAVVAEAHDLVELEISAVVRFSQDHGPVGAAISADGWKSLAKLPNLRRLYISGVPINEETARGIATLSTLRELDINGQLDDRALAPLAGLTALTQFRIHQKCASAAGVMRVVAKLRDLEDLYLCRQPVGDGDMKVIAELPRLKTLTIYETKVGDAGVLALATSRTLTRVSIEDWKSPDLKAVLAAVEKAKDCAFLSFRESFYFDSNHPFFLKPKPDR
jgi:hypothetical protein